MVNWTQCGLLWLIVVITFATPLVRLVASRLVISVIGASIFVLFAFLNAYNHGALLKRNQTEIFGYPYSYYDNRPAGMRTPRNFSAVIPGAAAHAESYLNPASLLANFAAYLIVTTIAAWPIAGVEAFMRRRSGRPKSDSESSLHDRPAWAR